MHLEDMKNFLLIVEQGSFSQASEILHISQPTLSRRLKKMEDQLGVKLLNRTRPKVELTEAGQIFIKRAEQILKEYDYLLRDLQAYLEGRAGQVSIAYLNFSQLETLFYTIQELNRNYKGLHIKTEQMPLPEIRRKVANKEFDLGFDMTLDKNEEDLAYYKISESGLYAVVSTVHPLAHRKAIQLKDLDKERIIIYQRQEAPELYDSIIQQFTSRKLEPRISDDYTGMQDLIMAASIGEGIALLDSTCKILENEHVRFIPIVDNEITYSWYIIYSKSNENPYLSTVLEVLLSHHS